MSKTLDPKCPVARTLDIIGERWTILILRDLFMQGPRRFQDLQNSLSGIAPNTISARIKTLEEAGVVERKLYSEHPPRAVYSLTERGLALKPALLALRDWGEKYTEGPPAPRLKPGNRIESPVSVD
ncbi:helix-turn-helix domain-containing protein [Thalassospiraceae bacterium LMO-JJ14]|nr:helix-turn-helix domain-containing protein [Thalassospiraceae bacterium LMO-JJ14]